MSRSLETCCTRTGAMFWRTTVAEAPALPAGLKYATPATAPDFDTVQHASADHMSSLAESSGAPLWTAFAAIPFKRVTMSSRISLNRS